MAITRVKTWIDDEILTASDLNAEFNNFINNALSLISPLTGTLDLDGNELVLDSDADTSITADTDDQIDIRAAGKDQWQFLGTSTNEGNFTAIDTDTGAAAGPIWAMYRNATGATSDVLGRLLWQGKDDGGTKTDFSYIEVELTDASAGSEDSAFNIFNTIAGTATEQWHIGAGIYAEGNTDPGAGKIDADGLLISGTDIEILLKGTKGGDIASASPLVIDTDGNYFDVTGTTGFSQMTVAVGRTFMLQFDAALTMTDGANLDLGGADIVTVAGDRGIFYATAADTTNMLQYQREGVAPYVLATQAQMETGTATNVAVPVGRVQNHAGVAKGWFKVDVAGSVSASHNVTGVNDDATGKITVTWATDFSGTDYSVMCAVQIAEATFMSSTIDDTSAPAAGTTEINCYDGANALADPTDYHVAAYGDQ